MRLATTNSFLIFLGLINSLLLQSSLLFLLLFGPDFRQIIIVLFCESIHFLFADFSSFSIDKSIHQLFRWLSRFFIWILSLFLDWALLRRVFARHSTLAWQVFDANANDLARMLRGNGNIRRVLCHFVSYTDGLARKRL